MENKLKYSIFTSSTYDDLKEERLSLFLVALENGYIPMGMEQLHSAPADQWMVITKYMEERKEK